MAPKRASAPKQTAETAPKQAAKAAPKFSAGDDERAAQLQAQLDWIQRVQLNAASTAAMGGATPSLTIRDIRQLFETSADANVVRDCVRAIGAGVGGVFDTELQDYQRQSALDRLVVVSNTTHKPRVVTKYLDFTIAPVEFHQPYFIDGMFIRSGYNVCSEDGWINVMPGACWFMTIADATRGIHCLIEAGGSPRAPYQKDDGVGKRFWKLMEVMKAKSS